MGFKIGQFQTQYSTTSDNYQKKIENTLTFQTKLPHRETLIMGLSANANNGSFIQAPINIF
jgi:hypothetical protein